MTANAMLKDGWVLLEIATIKRGPLYILGKRIVSKRGASAEVLPGEKPLLGDGPIALPPNNKDVRTEEAK